MKININKEIIIKGNILLFIMIFLDELFIVINGEWVGSMFFLTRDLTINLYEWLYAIPVYNTIIIVPLALWITK